MICGCTAFAGVGGSAAGDAREIGGLEGAEETTELARVVDARRRGGGAVRGTSDQPNTAASRAVSELGDVGGLVRSVGGDVGTSGIV